MSKLIFDNWKNQILLMVLAVAIFFMIITPVSTSIPFYLEIFLFMISIGTMEELLCWILHGTRVPGAAELADKLILFIVGNSSQLVSVSESESMGFFIAAQNLRSYFCAAIDSRAK